MAFSSETARRAGDVLRERLFGVNNGVSLHGGDGLLDQQSKAIRELQELLQRTVSRGEGNSLLVIGPRGSGKTWVLEQALKKVSSHAQCKGNFITVHLNGLVHTDDRLALLEIVKQLDVKEDFGDKITLSFSGLLEYLLQALREGDNSKQSVVVVLDNFDLFTHHKNQMLLYNLFDIAQSRSTPLAVVGLTCRLDAVELLEKRVKSRFSHTQLTLFNEHTFEQYIQLFCSLLTLPDKFPDRKYRDKWNTHVKELSEDARVRDSLQRVYRFSPDVGSLINLLTVPICRLGLRDTFLRPTDFVFSLKLLEKEAVSAILCGISVLELCLVIAMKHVQDISEDEPFNFEMVYSEYKKFTQRSHSVEFFGKPVALKAFEHLIALELVCPADSGGLPTTRSHGNKVMKEYQSVVLTLGEDQFKEAIQSYPNCPTDVQRWGKTTGIA